MSIDSDATADCSVQDYREVMNEVAHYLAISGRTALAAVISIAAIVLSDRLPKLIEGAVMKQLDSEMSDAFNLRIAERITAVSCGFVSSVGALFGLYVSALTEVWKISDKIPSISALAFFIAAFSAVPLTTAILRMDWVSMSVADYEATTGRRLKVCVYALAIALCILTLSESIMGEAPVSNAKSHADNTPIVQRK